MSSGPPQIIFDPSLREMSDWGGRICIPLGSAEDLAVLYGRAQRHLFGLRSELVQHHGFRDGIPDPRMLFMIECPSPYRSANGMPLSPPFRLQMPVHVSTFFSPNRRTQWQMIFHSALFPAMRHTVKPLADIFCLLQCLLTGLVVIVMEEAVPGQGKYLTSRALPSPEWMRSNQDMLLEIFGPTRFQRLITAAADRRMSFKLAYQPEGKY
ncbi:hypothetical protein BD410DRAFT_431501 [Rickenella mellea]|uniref:Uncharacterized protein n=1 Tax=Rickenella mellea TaxID=50990 RepID=A0A4Y7QJ57_9AGAM|nr:hypothetical protein BD410DRAFT_431501 [Rickenella mellea]